MKRKMLASVSAGVLLASVLVIVLWTKKSPESDDRHDFDWNAIKRMVVAGNTSTDRYSVEEVKLRHVPMPAGKVFFVRDKKIEALLGPKQALVVYYPETKILDSRPEHLKMILETRRYTAGSLEELLALSSEVAPLLYGSRPTQHEIVTESELIGSGRLPITKDTIQVRGKQTGLFVNYYAKIGPWGDVVNVTAVLKHQQLRISIHAIYLAPRIYA